MTTIIYRHDYREASVSGSFQVFGDTRDSDKRQHISVIMTASGKHLKYWDTAKDKPDINIMDVSFEQYAEVLTNSQNGVVDLRPIQKANLEKKTAQPA